MDAAPISRPELDYAFLAEYARVEGNSLTAVGASFTSLAVPVVPFSTTIYVAGRFRAPADGGPFAVEVHAGKAHEDPAVIMVTSLDPADAVAPYRGRAGMTFAVGLPVTFASPGMKQVQVVLEGQVVRDLYFEVAEYTETDD